MTRNSSQNLQEILERLCRLFLQESFRKPFLSVLYIWIDFFIVQNLSVLFPYPRSHINRLVISRIVRLLIRWRACPFTPVPNIQLHQLISFAPFASWLLPQKDDGASG